ncbi:hypothetical protein JCM10213_005552 [Rhodosporidiobolus nylandii]
MTATAALQTTQAAAYPPQNSLQAALQQGNESMATINLGQEEGRRCQHHQHGHETEEEREAMRLRGGCFNLGLCGCPDCDCCIIPCTIM